MARSRSPTDVRIGIVGCGRAAASLHLPALSRVRGAEIVALSEIDPARLAEMASRCPGAAVHPDYRALVHDDRVDLVAVCVPATLHAEVATAALRAGKHVFIEKPLALTLADCDGLVDEAGRAALAGVRSVVGFNLRSHRLLRQASRIIRSGALGEIELLRTIWTADWTGAGRPEWHALRSRGGGALFEIGVHQADLWRWLLQREVETIHTLSRSLAFDDQTATLQVRMTGGTLVSAAVSQRSVPHNIVEVFGSHGSVRLSCYHADSLEIETVGAASSGARRRLGLLLRKVAKLPSAMRAARGGGDFRMSYVDEWNHIVRALRHGGAMPATVHDGRQAAAIVLAALRSSQEGAAVAPGSHPALPESRAG